MAALHGALQLEAGSPAQRTALAGHTRVLQAEPTAIAASFELLLRVLVDPASSALVQRWAVHLVAWALCRPALPIELKLPLALQSLDVLALLLASPDLVLKKATIQVYASVYPLLFKNACNGTDHSVWEKVVQIKELVLDDWHDGSVGAKIAAVKVVQRVIQTQTRGNADPRLQRTAEPNISMCRANHPFLKLGALEDEANKLLEECITLLFTSDIPDLVSALVNSLTALLKSRPTFASLIITAFSNWTPAALVDCTATEIRSVEKTVKISLTHLLKTAHASAFAAQVTDFLRRQSGRMEVAITEAKQRKRQLMTDDLDGSAKRRRVEGGMGNVASFVDARTGTASTNALASFDAKTLPLELVVELVISSLQILSDAALNQSITASRRNIPAEIAEPKIEPVDADPLRMDLADEESEMKVDGLGGVEPADESDDEAHELDQEEDLELALAPSETSDVTKTAMMESAMRRLCAAGMEGASTVIWTPLVARLITRGMRNDYDMAEDDEIAETRREALRQIVFDFVIADLQSRMEFARSWLNEEWFVEGSAKEDSKERPYDRWLARLLEHILSYSSNKDKSFAQFMVDLPEIPKGEISRLGEMCKNPEQLQLGFSALRDLALLRPPVRQEAVDVLLSLTTHSDKLTRNAAIMTVKQWVPEVTPLSRKVVSFALSLLARLEIAPLPVEKIEKMEEDDVKPADGPAAVVVPPTVVAVYPVVKDGLVESGLPTPTTLSGVVQHIELYLALCAKTPDLLDHLFESYTRLQPFAQQSVQTLITPLIRSLGAAHAKIPPLIRSSPVGADALVLRVLMILATDGRPPPALVAIVKELAEERPLSSKFYVMLMPDANKLEILKYLPQVIGLLNGTPEEKATVRTVFGLVTVPPAQSFGGSMGSSVSRARQQDLLTHVELLVLLHSNQIGLKQAIEAIAICFSMSDAFRPEVLAAFMQRVVDDQVLPVLFLRTVIQAVSTYKSLQQFVSTTLLSRLITKQVWKTPSLWEGFIRCAKVIAPNSFNALLQLPLEQLKEFVAKQPTLRGPIREFVLNKGGNTNSRIDSLLAILQGDE